VDLSLFQQTKGFLSLHLGTINRENLGRMEKAATLSGHLVKPFNQVENTTYVVVAGPAEADQGIAPLLKTADFRPIKIPPEFSDYPDKVKHELHRRTLELKRKLAEKRGEIEALERLHRMELDQACLTLKMTKPFASLADLLQGHGSLAALEGWIPSDQAHGLTQALEKRLSRPFVLHMREPLDEERTQVPSLMRHSRLLRAFTALVKNYGIPRYGEIDPTLLFTITFILMFGMMFGDVGHGAIFVLTGILLRKRFPGSMPFMAGAGLSSMAFGGLYGSIFGFEELFHPLWMAPLSNPMLMLEVALYWGIGFILIMNLLTGINLAAEGRWSQAILDNRGLAGMLLYAGGIYSGFRWLGEGIFGTPEALALLIPMVVILTYKWRRQE
ncbi:MAG: ATPase, partial [Gammaproteobacteria bacterium]|nr:ATPase [Gammaproteobacteria bacterium]